MNQHGYIGLLQIIILSILLTAASSIFLSWKAYSRSQTNEDAHLTAIYLAQKEISLAEEYLFHTSPYFTGSLNNQQIDLNNFTFTIKTIITTDNHLKKITTHINWQLNDNSHEYTLIKTVYINE